MDCMMQQRVKPRDTSVYGRSDGPVFGVALGRYYANGKSENGVNFRNPNDPNACSKVRARCVPLSSFLLTVHMVCRVSACVGVQGEATGTLWFLR